MKILSLPSFAFLLALFTSCSPGAIDLPPYVNPPSAPQQVVSVSNAVNLTFDPQLFSEDVYWEEEYYRFEKPSEKKYSSYRMNYYGEISITPGIHSLKIQNLRVPPDDGDHCFWVQKSREVNLKNIESVTLSVVIVTRRFEGSGLELIVDWGNSYESLFLSKEDLTNTTTSGIPTINPELKIPITADMVRNVNHFTVKLGVLPGASGEIFFDEIYLLAE